MKPRHFGAQPQLAKFGPTSFEHGQHQLNRRRTVSQAPDPKANITAEDEAYRRGILARSRNFLLFEALHDEGWVLWLDVDIVQV